MELASLELELLNEGTWEDGRPPERALVALFAAMSPDELSHFLRKLMCRALVEIERVRPENFAAIRDVVCGRHALKELDEAEWDFPGGDGLMEAVRATEASNRLWRPALKGLAHAVDAVALCVGAVIDTREHQRDPAEWARFNQRVADGEGMSPLLVTDEWKNTRQKDTQEAWRLLLTEVIRERSSP